MKCAKLGLCIFIMEVFVAPKGFAENSWQPYDEKYQQKQLAAYSDLFAPPPVLPIAKKNLLKLLKVEGACQKRAKRLFKMLRAYGGLSRPDQPDLINETARAGKRALEYLQNTAEDDKCFTDLALTYTIGSLAVLTDASQYEASPHFWSFQTMIRVPGKEVLPLLAIILANKERIQFITKKLRADPLSIYADQKDGKKVLGSYKCSQTEIKIDPYQRPYNVAATLVHEMDHLFRDKIFDMNFIDIPDMKSFILLDEALAALHASYIQRDAFMPEKNNLIKSQSDFIDDELLKMPLPPRLQLQIPGDLDFYSQNGVVNWVWRIRNTRSWGGNYQFNNVLDHTLFWYDLIEPVRKLYDIMSNAYFGNDLDEATEKYLNGKSLLKNIKPPFEKGDIFDLSNYYSNLSHVLSDSPIKISPVYSSRAPYDPRFNYVLNIDGKAFAQVNGISEAQAPKDFKLDFSNVLRIKEGHRYYDVGFEILSWIPTTGNWLMRPSPLCRAFENAINSHQLDNYLGSSFHERPGGEGVKPDDGKIRPGGEGVKPCIRIGDKM